MRFKHFIIFIILFLLITPTNALSNYETRFDIDYSSYDNFKDYPVDTNNTKVSDFVEVVKNNNSLTRPYTIVVYYTGGNLYSLIFYVFDTSSNYTFNLYGNNYRNFNYKFTSSNSKWGYSIDVGGSYPPNDIYQSNTYLNFITCASGGSCSNYNSFESDRKIFKSSTSINNDSNNSLSFDSSEEYVLYYSTFPLHISNTYDIDNTKVFYKSIYIDNQSIDVSDNFPTYYDYSHHTEPEPDPEPEPVPEPDIDTSGTLFNYVFWFMDNSTEYGVLSNIYILLFLYCIGNMIIKCLTIIYHTKNFNNRR